MILITFGRGYTKQFETEQDAINWLAAKKPRGSNQEIGTKLATVLLQEAKQAYEDGDYLCFNPFIIIYNYDEATYTGFIPTLG